MLANEKAVTFLQSPLHFHTSSTIYTHVKTLGFQILIKRMRKQCVPGSFPLPRKELGNDMPYPIKLLAYLVS